MRNVGCSSLPARQEKDPEGRMPLAEHLRELRNRLAKAMLAIVVVTVVAAVLLQRHHQLLHRADPGLGRLHKAFAELASSAEGTTCARDHDQRSARAVHARAEGLPDGRRRLRLAGLALPALGASSPPACTRTRRSTRSRFVGTGVPLFLGGAYFAYKVLPTTAKVLIDFTPERHRPTCCRWTTCSTSSRAWSSSSASPSSCRCCW